MRGICIFFLSGAFFPLQGLPKAIQTIVAINPLSYGVDGLRGAVTGVFNFSLSTDLIVLSLATTILISIGTYLFNKIQI